MKALDQDDIVEAIYAGADLTKCYAPNNTYNKNAAKLGLDLIPDMPIFSEVWFIPEIYKDLDLVNHFGNLVKTEDEARRVCEELDLFEKSGNTDLLRYLIYLSDTIKENEVVIGVGRGSSVSLYTLFLIGVHKVDSLKYNLDYHEFFKIKEKP